MDVDDVLDSSSEKVQKDIDSLIDRIEAAMLTRRVTKCFNAMKQYLKDLGRPMYRDTLEVHF